MVSLNRLWSGALAGILVGLLIGIGARLSMRMVALIGGMTPGFSLDGTLGILVLFMAFGIPFGALFAGVRSLAPLPALIWGGIYGLGWAILTAIPFLRNPGGELALVSPAVGIALFATLPLLGGLLLGVFVPWLDRRQENNRPRTVHIGWLIALALAVILAFMSMGSMMDSGIRSPKIIWDFYNRLGLSFMDAREVNRVLGILFTLGYTGLLIVLFFLGGQAQNGRVSVIVLLVFSAGFFSQRGLFTGMMDSLRLATLAVGLVKAVGATGLLLLLHTFPDGRFGWRWSRPLLMVVGVGSLTWYTLPVIGVQPGVVAPTVLQLAVVATILGSGLLVLATRLRHGSVVTRWQIAGPVLGFMVSVCWFLGLWGASLLIPSLGFADAGAPFAPLSVALYLLPWLLAPSTLLYAVVHRKLWSVVEWKNQSSQTIMAETSPALDVQYPEQAHYGEAL